MKISILSAGTLGVAGLVAAGLMAMPTATSASAGAEDRFAKRDDATPELVLVADDDDDDTNAKDDTNTRTRSNNTNSRSRNDNTGTGTRTGRDDSRDRKVKDVTNDGPGKRKIDFSRNDTNDRSRHNTRGR